MKSIKYIFLIITALFFFQCNDLEEDPIAILSPESVFNTAEDVESVIFSGYAILGQWRAYGRSYTMSISVRSDMVNFIGGNSDRNQYDDFALDANNGLTISYWVRFYELISTTNAAILGANSIELDEDVRNRLIAEARFLRGFAYFQLVRAFGELPYIDEFITEPNTITDIELTSEAEIYDNILADFEFASIHLPVQWDVQLRSRATNVAALSYTALVQLTRGNYTEAKATAEEIINNRGSYQVDLQPTYAELFDATDPEAQNSLNESIFYIDYDSQVEQFFGTPNIGSDGRNIDWMPAHHKPRGAAGGGFGNTYTSTAVVNSIDDSDDRKNSLVADVYFLDPTTNIVFLEQNIAETLTRIERFDDTSRDGAPVILKYFLRAYRGNMPTRGDNAVTDQNLHLMRFAEVLLIAAEANIELGNLSQAAIQIDEIRSRALLDPLSTAGVNTGDVIAMTQALRKERRIELMFEYKRWYDIKRWGIYEEAYGPSGFEPKDIVPTSNNALFPRPQVDIDINPNLAN